MGLPERNLSDMSQTTRAMQCCGMGGHLVYKKSFHPHTLSIGGPLFEQLLSEKDRVIITDCSTTRLSRHSSLVLFLNRSRHLSQIALLAPETRVSYGSHPSSWYLTQCNLYIFWRWKGFHRVCAWHHEAHHPAILYLASSIAMA